MNYFGGPINPAGKNEHAVPNGNNGYQYYNYFMGNPLGGYINNSNQQMRPSTSAVIGFQQAAAARRFSDPLDPQFTSSILTPPPSSLSSSSCSNSSSTEERADNNMEKSMQDGKVGGMNKVERMNAHHHHHQQQQQLQQHNRLLPPQQQPINLHGNCNLKRPGNEPQFWGTPEEDDSGESDSSWEYSDNDNSVNIRSSDNNQKSNRLSETLPFVQQLKIEKFRGSFTCVFCGHIKEYAADLAIHEAMIHSRIPPETKPGSKRRKRHQCPRCSLAISKRQYYIIHHLKDHLGLDIKMEQYKKQEKNRTEGQKFNDSEPCDICRAPVPKTKQGKYDHFRVFHNLNSVQPDKVKRCDICPAYFIKGVQLTRHKEALHGAPVKTKKNKKTYTCKDCGKQFCYLKRLWVHRRDACEMRHTFFWIGTCDVEGCGLKFENTSDMDYHMTHSHNGDKYAGTPMICPICGTHCTGEMGLRSHMEMHSDGQGYCAGTTCQVCGEELKSRTDFNKHMRCHMGPGTQPPEGNYVCDQCGKQFPIQSLLDLHYEFHKDPKNWRFECTVCFRKCSTKQSLQVHMRTHTGEKPYGCDTCGERFAYRHVLRWHINKKHEQEGVMDVPRPYTKNLHGDSTHHQHQSRPKDLKNAHFLCSECNKVFASKQALQVHTRTHTGEKPFPCKVCGEQFRYRHVLRTHVNQKHKEEGVQDVPRPYHHRRRPSNNEDDDEDDDDDSIQQKEVKRDRANNGDTSSANRFQCSTCSKTYSTKQALQVHSRTHTGEKPYNCPVCNERFRYRHVLRSHVNTRHEHEGVQDLPRPYNKRSSD